MVVTPTLRTLASAEEPFSQLKKLVAVLRGVNKENRFLEWKRHAPAGPTVSLWEKYRTVKVAISFANSEGGFIVFGVDPAGEWLGLTPSELGSVDPAHLTELINGCLQPDIPILNYTECSYGRKAFALLHVPPSPSGPHITTKQVTDKAQQGRVILARHALYCRQGAKSDFATPVQHHRLLAKRVDQLRDEMLRRVREVSVPVLTERAGPRAGRVASTISIARLTKDPLAPAVRITREAGASGILLHEELSDGLFESINNVVQANYLLSQGRRAFVLGEPIYYRVYAERQHVGRDQETIRLLAATALRDLYAPCLYWLLSLNTDLVATVLSEAAAELKSPQVRGLMRVALLLGPESTDWLWSVLDGVWGQHTQAPDYYYTFKSLRTGEYSDARLRALRLSDRAQLSIPPDRSIPLAELLTDPAECAALLSRSCMQVYSGAKDHRSCARQLDVLAYGAEVGRLGADVASALASRSPPAAEIALDSQS
jgi:hypothetical protein